jgi:selenide, water dikinase
LILTKPIGAGIITTGIDRGLVTAAQVPVFAELWDLIVQGAVPEGTHNNHRFLAHWTDWHDVPREKQIMLCDAQTSGGLLIAVAPERKAALVAALGRSGVLSAEIGSIVAGPCGRIAVVRG